jgi:hypothetical protein
MRQRPLDAEAYQKALAEFDRALLAGELDGPPVEDLPEAPPLGEEKTLAVFVHRPKQTRGRARRSSR